MNVQKSTKALLQDAFCLLRSRQCKIFVLLVDMMTLIKHLTTYMAHCAKIIVGLMADFGNVFKYIFILTFLTFMVSELTLIFAATRQQNLGYFRVEWAYRAHCAVIFAIAQLSC